MDFLLATFLGKPSWMWLGFLPLVGRLIAFDLGVVHRKTKEIGVGESLRLSAFCVLAGLGFGGLVWWQHGPRSGLEYFIGFVVEKSPAMDNIFVIALFFGFLAIPRALQHRMLFWKVILGVILLRVELRKLRQGWSRGPRSQRPPQRARTDVDSWVPKVSRRESEGGERHGRPAASTR